MFKMKKWFQENSVKLTFRIFQRLRFVLSNYLQKCPNRTEKGSLRCYIVFLKLIFTRNAFTYPKRMLPGISAWTRVPSGITLTSLTTTGFMNCIKSKLIVCKNKISIHIGQN